MKEIWKDIEGYEGLYQVSNTGLVRNVVRGRLLKPGFNRNGYLKCVLSKGGKHSTAYIHRLVASAFIENPLGLPQVNHLDEDKTNNVADNLEWCTSKYNLNYGSAQERRVQKNIENGKCFGHTGLETVYIKEYRRMYYEKTKERRKEYLEKNKERIRKLDKEYRERNKEKIREKCRRYYETHKEERKRYYEEHKEEIKEKMREYLRRKKKKD